VIFVAVKNIIKETAYNTVLNLVLKEHRLAIKKTMNENSTDKIEFTDK